MIDDSYHNDQEPRFNELGSQGQSQDQKINPVIRKCQVSMIKVSRCKPPNQRPQTKHTAPQSNPCHIIPKIRVS